MPLNRRATQQQIRLIIIIPEPPQIFDTPQRCLPVRHRRIQIVLLALLVNAEPFKCQVPARSIMRFDRPGEEQGRFHAEVSHAVFHDGEFDGDDAGHFYGTTERDFAVALGEVEVADAEFGAFHMDGEVDFAAAAEILDIAVPAMLRAARDGPRAFLANLCFYVTGAAASVHVLGLRGLSDNLLKVLCLVGIDELAFAAVPFGEDFGGGGAAKDAGVD